MEFPEDELPTRREGRVLTGLPVLTSVLSKVYQGALSPEALQMHVRQENSNLDLTTVTAVTLSVKQPDGVEVTWGATIAAGPTPPAATPTDLWIVYGFLAGDVDKVGEYSAFANLTTGSGVIRSAPSSFEVEPKFGKKRSGS